MSLILPANSHRKIRTATTVYPDAATIVSPRRTLDARRSAALVHESHPTAHIHRTVVSPAIVGAAPDCAHSWTWSRTTVPAQHKVRTASTIDPDPVVVETIGGALDTRRAAPLVHHSYPAAGIHPAKMPSAIVRRACHPTSIGSRNAALRPQPATGTNQSNKNRCKENIFRSTHL